MLKAAQRERCRVIAAALDAGDLQPWRRAEALLSPAEKGLVWDLRKHVQAQAARVAQAGAVIPTVGKTPRPARIEASLDLDYWSDTDDPPDDDPDDELTLTTKTCDNCRGSGVASDGTRCARCGGSGRIPIDPDDDPDDDLEDE